MKVDPPRPPLRVRLCLALAWSCVSSVTLYAIVRAVQARLFPEANPATVIWSAHAGYFWRIWIVTYTSGAIGFVTFWWSGTRAGSDRLARTLEKGVVVAAVAIALQGLFLP